MSCLPIHNKRDPEARTSTMCRAFQRVCTEQRNRLAAARHTSSKFFNPLSLGGSSVRERRTSRGASLHWEGMRDVSQDHQERGWRHGH